MRHGRDDPNGSASANTAVQLFHCHGYATNGAPQRWYFAPWGTVAPGDLLTRITSHDLCLGPDNGQLSAGSRVGLVPCAAFGPLWNLLSRNAYSGDPDFQLELGSSGYCMTLPDWSGGNNEPVILEPCNIGSSLQHWNLG